MSAARRLHPGLQHALVHDLEWRELRPVQEAAIDAILDGANVVVLAPTAGGKTEAAVLPVLSRILTESTPPVAALYVCPIRALLNNQEPRLRRYARMVGLDAFKWHGDVGAAAKQTFGRDPRHLLLTTPESLEVMLVSQKFAARALFAPLTTVIVDEIHAFAGDDRGAHLVSLLERLSRFAGRDLQRIGLSATVGNPGEIGRWLQGSSRRDMRVVDPAGPATPRDFSVERVEDAAAAAREAARLAEGRKALVFVDSRSLAERVAAAMAGRAVDVFVHHSAVSRRDRQEAEERFASAGSAAIVCTSTMELGIDVGDLDLVVQVDAPPTVASVLQRVGRTGRRAGTRGSGTFLCQTPEAMLQAAALVRLAERGWVEDVAPDHAAAHVLAHQILALTLQEGGVSRHRVLEWLGGAASFTGLGEADVGAVVEAMLGRAILHEGDGLLSLGSEGERRFGGKNFFDLYAVFSSPAALRVLHGNTEIGAIDASFLSSRSAPGRSFCFRLAGRAWVVREVDWPRGTCRVTPAADGAVPSWQGAPRGLSRAVCTEMKRLLAEDSLPPWLGRQAAHELVELRRTYDGLVAEGEAPLEERQDQVIWHTFAGAAINRTLAAGLESVSGKHWVAGNLSLKSPLHTSLAEAGAATAALRSLDWQDVVRREAGRARSGTMSKFEVCLPEEMLRTFVGGRLYEAEGARGLFEAGAAARVGSTPS